MAPTGMLIVPLPHLASTAHALSKRTSHTVSPLRPRLTHTPLVSPVDSPGDPQAVFPAHSDVFVSLARDTSSWLLPRVTERPFFPT